MQIYLARNQVQAGPYTLEQVNRMLASREVELSDLMWHEGMENWQTVGTLTNNAYVYHPQNLADSGEHRAASPSANQSDDNKDNNKSVTANEQRRRTVDELFGNRTARPTEQVDSQPKRTPQSPFGIKQASKDSPVVQQNSYPLANIGSRILAVLLDQVLAIVCIVPLLSGLGFDREKLTAASASPEDMMALMETIPQHLVVLSSLMILALLCVQVYMLIKRGQSLGKLATGIRIVDEKTKTIPSVTNIILLRTILTNIAYNLPVVGQIVLIADFTIMLIDKKNRSLHDRIASTLVVKAQEEQLVGKLASFKDMTKK